MTAMWRRWKTSQRTSTATTVLLETNGLKAYLDIFYRSPNIGPCIHHVCMKIALSHSDSQNFQLLLSECSGGLGIQDIMPKFHGITRSIACRMSEQLKTSPA